MLDSTALSSTKLSFNPLTKDILWNKKNIALCYNQPFSDLLYTAQTVHRTHFNPNIIQVSKLMSIKTGACPEDCAYCPQSGHYKTGIEKEALLDIETILATAKKAKANGASRFCMGAAWKSPPKKALPKLKKIIESVAALGLETCMTLGTLSSEQAKELSDSGLDYYNHNIDTSERYYKEIITTRDYQERLDTLSNVRESGMHTCCGGILGMGETQEDRVAFLHQLATLPSTPESIPLNRLIPIPGTPLENAVQIPEIEFVRVVATARIIMPKAVLRLSAGRETMSTSLQTLCFLAGANSIFHGDKLLTAPNPSEDKDAMLFAELGLSACTAQEQNAGTT